MSSCTVNVSDYGAIANSGKDAANGIRLAVNAATKCGPGSIVRFDEGTYIIGSISPKSPKDTFHTLYFKGLNDIIFEGNNTTLLICDSFMDVFNFSRCKSVTVKGFTVDYLNLPWVQGEVIAIDKENSTFTFKVDNLLEDGSCFLDDPRWLDIRKSRVFTSPFGMVRDNENPLLFKKDTPNFFYKFIAPKKIDTGIYEIGFAIITYQKWIGTHIKVGSKLVLNNRIDSVGTFRFDCCKGNIQVSDCNIHASNGTIFCMDRIDGNVLINNVKVLLKDDNWITANAAGMYLSNINGSVKVYDSIFEGISDDCVVLYSDGYIITDVISPTELHIKGTMIPNVGDMITVHDTVSGAVRGRAMVKLREDFKTGDNLTTETTALLVLNKPIDNINSGISRQDGDIMFDHRMQAVGTEISGCIFRYGRAKGVRICTREFTVKDNVFENLGYGAIMLHDIPAIGENFGTSYGKILNNKINKCGYLQRTDSEDHATISVYGMRLDGGVAQGYIHDNLTVKDNEICHVAKCGIYISSAIDVVVENNSIKSELSDGRSVKMSGLTLQNVKNVTVRKLNLKDPRPYLQAGIRILNPYENITLLRNNFVTAEDVADVYKE